MKFFKKTIEFLIAIIFILFFTSCTQAEILQPADELKSGIWQTNDNFGKEIKLEFDGDNASIYISNDNIKKSISGIASIDNSTINISDSDFCENFCFEYKLYGNKIDLIYNNYTITLNKVDVKNQ